MEHSFTAKSPTDLNAFAHALLRERPNLLALVGPLGAGKTTLAQAIGQALGIGQQVTSPTYVLQQVYRVAGYPVYDTLVHVDCYRIKVDHEVPALDLAYWAARPKTLVVIEWADRIAKHLADLRPVWVTFMVHGGERRLRIS